MKTERYVGPLRLLALSVLLAMIVACGKKAPEAPKPAPPAAAVRGPQKTITLPDPAAVAVPDVAVAVRVNRLDQLLPKIEGLVSQIRADINADTIKARMGRVLNDPALSGVDQSRPILLCVFDPAGAGPPRAALVIPVTSDQYKTKFQAMGMHVYQKEGGKTLLIAQAEPAAVAGRKSFDQLEALLGQPMTGDVNVYVNVEMLMTHHTAEIEAVVNQMSQMMEQMEQAGAGMAGSSAMLAMEVRAVLSTIKEIKDLGLDISVSKDGLDLGAILRAKQGTALAKLCDQPVIPDMSALSYVPGSGAIIGCSGGDSGKASDFFGAKIDEVFTATSGPAVLVKRAELKSLLDRFLRLQKSKAFDFLCTTGSALNGVSIVEVTDPTAYINEMKNLPKNLEAAGIIAFYKKMNMTMTVTFKENVRNHNGVPIHQMITDVTLPQTPEMPPFMAGILKNVTHQEYEIAATGNYVIHDMGTKKVEAIIDAIKAKKPLWTPTLNAQSVFPKEGCIYADILPGRLASWGVQIAQSFLGPLLAGAGPEADAVLARFKTLQTKPISFFASVSQGKVQTKLVLPVDPILKIQGLLAGPPPAPPKAL